MSVIIWSYNTILGVPEMMFIAFRQGIQVDRLLLEESRKG
jgi:hypothetical protein